MYLSSPPKILSRKVTSIVLRLFSVAEKGGALYKSPTVNREEH